MFEMTDIDSGLPPVIEEDDSPNTSQMPLIQHKLHADSDYVSMVASSGDCHPPDTPDIADHPSSSEKLALKVRVEEDLRNMREPDAQCPTQY